MACENSSGLLEGILVMLDEFVTRVQEHPDLKVVHADESICIVDHQTPEGHRPIRLGLWAIQRINWEQFARACDIPVAVAG